VSEPGTPSHPHHPRRLHLELSPLERARLWVEIIAFVAAGAWAIYVFVYQTHIAPLLEPPHMTVTTEVSRVGETPNAYVERSRITLTNDGRVPFDVAALAVNLYGVHPNGTTGYAVTKRNGIVIGEAYLSVGDSDNTLIASNASLNAAAQGGFRGRHVIMQPGDSVHMDLPAFVPRGRYDALMLATTIIYVRYPFSSTVPIRLTRTKNGGLDVTSSAPLEAAFPVRMQSFSGI
jgi:hypothetical protein